MLRFRRRYSQNCGLEAGPQARDRRAKPTRPGASTECATTGRQVKGKGRVTEISRQQICKCESGKGCADAARRCLRRCRPRSEAHTSELQSLMRISYAVFCVKTTKRTRARRR